MDKQELENWQKVKEHMEEKKSTDNFFYQRAVAICNGEPDPLDRIK